MRPHDDVPITSLPAEDGQARRPGVAQGVVLTSVATLSVMGVVLLAPVLPLMQAHFAEVPGAAALVRIALTLPALCVFLLSPLAGILADRISRRTMLIVATMVYAVFGTAPLYLDGLPALIASRVGVGVAEAVLMTASTALIGDYFLGGARDRWFAAQTGVAALSAVMLFILGGALGDFGWRAPFLAYGASLAITVLLVLFTWEPAQRQQRQAVPGTFQAAFPWAATWGLLALTLFGSVVFYIVPLQLPFLLQLHGITAPSRIGLATGLGSLAVPAGSVVFTWLRRAPRRVLLPLGFVLAAAGLFATVAADGWQVMLAGVMLNQFGCGLYLPALLSATVEATPADLRGRASGLWMGCFFLGQFASPLLVLALTGATSGLPSAVGLFAGLSLAVAVYVAAWRVRPSPAEAS